MRASSKYRNKKTVVDGITFDSMKEARRYEELRLLEKAGEISHLELQPSIKIVIAGIELVFDSGRHVTYNGDFRYFDERRRHFVVEDTKGFRTRDYKLKKAMVRAMGIDIVES